jgi:hypothetical protein
MVWAYTLVVSFFAGAVVGFSWGALCGYAFALYDMLPDGD